MEKTPHGQESCWGNRAGMRYRQEYGTDGTGRNTVQAGMLYRHPPTLTLRHHYLPLLFLLD